LGFGVVIVKFAKERMMKVLRVVAMSLMMLTSLSGWAQSDAQKALDRFKSMAGTWAGKSAQGQPSEVTYRLMAGGLP
jgi:hypothetical protein